MRFAVITTFKSRFSVKKVSVVIPLFTIFRTLGIRLFCKHERSVLFYNTSGFIISVYKSCLRQLSYCDLDVRVVSVFGKKSDAVCSFFGVFLCGFAVFGTLLHPPLHTLQIISPCRTFSLRAK